MLLFHLNSYSKQSTVCLVHIATQVTNDDWNMKVSQCTNLISLLPLNIWKHNYNIVYKSLTIIRQLILQCLYMETKFIILFTLRQVTVCSLHAYAVMIIEKINSIAIKLYYMTYCCIQCNGQCCLQLTINTINLNLYCQGEITSGLCMKYDN